MILTALLSALFLLIFFLKTEAIAQQANKPNQVFQENFSDTFSDPQAASEFEEHFSDDFKMSPSEIPLQEKEDAFFISPFLEHKIENIT